MGQDPTAKPAAPSADLTEQPQQFDSDAEETAEQVAYSVADNASEVQLKTTDCAPGDVVDASDKSPLSPVAATLVGDRPTFIDTLARALEADLTPAMLFKLQRAARSASNEAAAFERLAIVTIDDAKPSAAAKICAALAARTTGLSAHRAKGACGSTDAAQLFTAWLETARAMIAARGSAGLQRLLPTARLLARRSAERGDSAAEIAATMHRIAARIVAELSLERAFDLAAAEQEPDLTEQRTVSPGSALSQSPAQMTLHLR
jgi:hypothetical protein